MPSFVLLYSGGAGMPETEAEQAAVMQAWGAWFGSLGDSLVDGGNPFTPMSKSIKSNGTVSDSPIVTGANGYTIIKADSLDEAVEKSKGCPNLQSGEVTIYETFPVM